jgi:hypothetical protein
MPHSPGAIFVGYYTEPDTGGVQYYDANMNSARAFDQTTDLVLYARFVGIVPTHDITLELAFGASDTNTITVVGGMLPHLMPDQAPTRPGHIFVGYFDTLEGGRAIYSAAMQAIDIFDYSHDILYARWRADDSIVAMLNSSGGQLQGESTIAVVYGRTPPVVQSPIMDGYDFLGWYSYEGVQYHDRHGTPVRTWDIATSTTLYARWLPRVQHLALEDMYGAAQLVALSTHNNQRLQARVYTISGMQTATAPTSEGRTFVGYFDSNGNRYLDSSMRGTRVWTHNENNRVLHAVYNDSHTDNMLAIVIAFGAIVLLALLLATIIYKKCTYR